MKIVVLVLTMLFLTGCREYPEAVGYWRDGVEIKKHNNYLDCFENLISCDLNTHNYCKTIRCDRNRSRDRKRCHKVFNQCMRRFGK